MASTFTVPLDQIDNYSGNRSYLCRRDSDGLETIFRVTNRVPNIAGNTATIYTDVTLPPGTSVMYSFSEAYYRTTKRVNRIDINFAAQVWARNSNNELLDFAQFYQVRIKAYRQSTYTQICTLVIQSKRPDRLLRGITIGDLPLDTYDIQIRPLVLADTPANIPCLVLRDWGDLALTSISTFNGGSPYLRSQGYIESNPPTFNAIGNQQKERTPSNSPQQAPTLQLLNVNEIEYSSATTRFRDLALTGLATVEATIKFDAQLNGGINLRFFVTEGIAILKPVATGTADAGSVGGTLVATGVTVTNPVNYYVRNLDKQIDAVLASTNGALYTTTTSLEWEEGDRYLLSKLGLTCWWPEIYAWLAWDPRFGLSQNFGIDFDIDWQSIIDNTIWVSGTNEHNTKFAWHGMLKDSKEIAAINAEMCKQVMLFPCKRSGKSGFFPQKTPDTGNGAIYNSSNATKFRLEYAATDHSLINQLTTIYQELEQTWMSEPELQFTQQSVTANTWNAAKGLETVFGKTIPLPHCTSRLQAIKTAQILLNLARFGGQISVSFSASTIESLSLPVGDLFRLQTAATVYDGQQSGMVVEKSGSWFRLDRDPILAEGLTNGVSANGLTDLNIDFIDAGVSIGDLAINSETGVTSPITWVNSHSIECVPVIPIDTYYQIVDLTSSGLAAIVGGSGTSQPVVFQVGYTNGHAWYRLSVPVKITDVVLIGKNKLNDRLFQCLSCSPTIGTVDNNGTAQIESPIIGANWTPRFYDYSDIEVVTRDNIINPPV